MKRKGVSKMTGVGFGLLMVMVGAVIFLSEDIDRIREEIIEEERRHGNDGSNI